MVKLIKWDPFEELERFLGEKFFVSTISFSPMPVDIYENEKELVVEVGLPGIKKEDISLKVEEDRIIIEGKKEEKKEVKEENYYRKEIKRGEFKRVIALPYEVDADKTKAEMKDGILKIIFPKEVKKKGKEINIE